MRFSLSLLVVLPVVFLHFASAEESGTLASKLEAAAEASRQRLPAETQELMKAGTQAVVESGVVQHAKQVGDQAPDFTLPDGTGTPVRLATLLEKGPVVLTWYRGGWCPYCNLALTALQEKLPEIAAAGATLVALTPELPDHSLSTKEKNALGFSVLTDRNNAIAETYGVVFTLTPEVAKLYNTWFDLASYNGAETGSKLPLAATYIIRSDGNIAYAFLDADYRKRAEPQLIVDELAKLNAAPVPK